MSRSWHVGRPGKAEPHSSLQPHPWSQPAALRNYCGPGAPSPLVRFGTYFKFYFTFTFTCSGRLSETQGGLWPLGKASTVSPDPGQMCVCQGLPQGDHSVIFSSTLLLVGGQHGCCGFLFAGAWPQCLDDMLPELASPEILLLMNLVSRLVVFPSRMVALLEPGLEDPVCRHVWTWQCVNSTGFCNAGMTCLPVVSRDLYPFRTAGFMEETGGKAPTASLQGQSKIKAGAKTKAQQPEFPGPSSSFFPVPSSKSPKVSLHTPLICQKGITSAE